MSILNDESSEPVEAPKAPPATPDTNAWLASIDSSLGTIKRLLLWWFFLGLVAVILQFLNWALSQQH